MKFSIPTEYNGITFRSKLEASWARLFDANGWKWAYEPFYVNGWLPDFILHGKKEILVEVKPYDYLPLFYKSGQIEKMHRGLIKKYRREEVPEILLLGTLPMFVQNGSYIMIGWLCEAGKESNFNQNGMWFNHAVLGLNKDLDSEKKIFFDFNHTTGSKEGRMSGQELDHEASSLLYIFEFWDNIYGSYRTGAYEKDHPYPGENE